jgi:glycosyltransferase involved in cell wall biosynthesis
MTTPVEAGDAAPELSVVMPAYGEERGIAGVVSAWMAELDRLGIDYEFLVYDDGSKDRTREVLQQLAAERPRLLVSSHSNRGHGPTILIGYREARGEWVFQTDSDGEMSPVHFEALWNHRRDFDFLVGYREHRQSAPARQLVTAASRLAVKLLFGRSVRDVNSPYRLMRRASLTKMLRCLPPTTFAPNVVLAGLAGRMKLRLYEVPVPHSGQRTVTAALNKWKLWKTALRCFTQTASVALSARSDAR